MAVHSTLLPTLRNTSTTSIHPNCPCKYESICQFLDLILVLNEALDGLEVSLDHLLDETGEVDFALPAQEPFSFGRVTEEEAKEKETIRDQKYEEGRGS